MNDVFSFPEKFKIERDLTADQFIEFGNLTDIEKDRLRKYLVDLTLLYDIKCPDSSELIVLGIQFNYFRLEYGLVKEIITTVATALPYPTVVYAVHDKKARIYTFAQHINKQNGYRSKIDRVRATHVFPADEPDAMVCGLTEEMGRTVLKIPSAEELQNFWLLLFSHYTPGGLTDFFANTNF